MTRVPKRKPPGNVPKINAGSTVAYRRDHIIRLAAGVTCPHYEHELWADVVERIGNEIGIVCGGCRRELVTIGNDTRP